MSIKKDTTEPKIEVQINDKTKYYYGTGKRKTSIARVRLHEKGSGKVRINGKFLEDFNELKTIQYIILYPLIITGNEKTFDLSIKVAGGGTSSQAEAIRHGIARALVEFNAENRTILKKDGLLTRDARIKERKKYGLKRARRAPQFSKR